MHISDVTIDYVIKLHVHFAYSSHGKELQQKICDKIDNTSVSRKKVKSEIKEKIELMKALKASILDSAFKGEL